MPVLWGLLVSDDRGRIPLHYARKEIWLQGEDPIALWLAEKGHYC